MFTWAIRRDNAPARIVAGENVFDVLRMHAKRDLERYGEPDIEDGDVQGAEMRWYGNWIDLVWSAERVYT